MWPRALRFGTGPGLMDRGVFQLFPGKECLQCTLPVVVHVYGGLLVHTM